MLRRLLLGPALLVGGLVVVLVLARAVGVLHTYRVVASSMEPTLRCAGAPNCTAGSSDRVLTVKYVGFSPARGDIVAFHTPPLAAARCGAGGVFVKRIVALPRETWSERSGYVFVNGRKLPERYVAAAERDARTIAPSRVPAGRYVLLGDARSFSCDSRAWGTVAKRELIGKVVATYWPPGRIAFR